jgi:hypothetical protein
MHTSKKWLSIAGLVLHGLIAAPMVLAGGMKLLAPPAVVEGAQKAGLGDHLLLIGTGELITAVLLVVPRTSSLGVLLASAFWGGAIVAHMSHGEPYVVPSVLLALTWLGAYLRLPAMFGSFAGARTAEPGAPSTSLAA